MELAAIVPLLPERTCLYNGIVRQHRGHYAKQSGLCRRQKLQKERTCYTVADMLM